MRYSALALVASLLAKDTVHASTLHGHRARHGKAQRDLIVVTDDVVVTSTVYTYVTVDHPGDATSTSSSATEPNTITTVQYVTVSRTVPRPTTTSTSASVAASPSSSTSSSLSTLDEDFFPAKSTSTPNAHATVYPPATSAAAQTTLQTVKSTSSSTTAAATTTANTSSSGKRGLPYNSASLTDPFLGSSSVIWAYNWASSSNGLSTKLEFVPMLWGLGSAFTSAWSAAATAAIASGSTALLAFNEPDLAAQANIGYADAAAGYLTHMQPFAGRAKLGAPAVTNGAAPMGLTYLKNFISSCSTCTIDFCAIHWYDSASNVEYFKKYMGEAQTACNGKPIWITEFGASGSSAEQATFLATVIPWLDAQSYIERYAYFMASDGVLLTGTSLSSIGEAFVSA